MAERPKIVKAVIPAAGFGTRMLPATKALPKEMLPVAGKQKRHLTDAAELVRRLAQLVELRFVEQEKPLGLAHAISCALSLIENEPFVVLLPDVIVASAEPATLQLIRAHQHHAGSVVAIREVAQQDVERHGIVRIERSTALPSSKSVRVTGLVEKP